MNIYDIQELQKYINNLNNTATVDYGNTQSGMATNFPFLPVNELPKQITYGFADDVYPPALPGITQTTAAKQFEEPFRIINGQKVYISDVIGTKQAEEKANFFQKPTGIMTQAKDFFTQTLPNMIKGGINMIPGMRFIQSLDRFDTLPYQDRKFIKSRMTDNVQGISVDPRTGLLVDAAGKNIRSLRGNYAETVDKEYDRYEKAIERAKDKYNVGFDGTKFTGANANIANQMNKRNINMFNFYKNQKAEKDTQRRNLLDKIAAQVKAGATAKKGAAMHGGMESGGGGQARFDGATSRAQYDKEPTAYSGSF